jgi:hypothetical protein
MQDLRGNIPMVVAADSYAVSVNGLANESQYSIGLGKSPGGCVFEANTDFACDSNAQDICGR